MRRSDKEITDRAIFEEILTKARICHIAFQDSKYPYLLTVNYGYFGNCLYIHTATDGKKIDLIASHPYICFQVMTDVKMLTGDDACSDWTMKYKSLTGYGKARIITDREEKIKGLNILMEHYTTKGPFEYSDQRLNETTVIKIEIETMTAKASI